MSGIHLSQLAVELNPQLEIQISIVSIVWLKLERAAYLFAFFHGKEVVQIKHCLFPVGVLLLGAYWRII